MAYVKAWIHSQRFALGGKATMAAHEALTNTKYCWWRQDKNDRSLILEGSTHPVIVFCFSPAVLLPIISAEGTLCRHPYSRWKWDHFSLIKYVYLSLIGRYSLASTTPPPVLILQCTCFQWLYGELLTGLKQIDCQHSSQGPSIRLSLSAAHTLEAMKHFALLLPHIASPSLSI